MVILRYVNTDTIINAYRQSTRRLLLLDYDGTLAPIVALPELAVPTTEVRELLRTLAANPMTTCVIVSGRSHETLDEWLGDLPIAFVAEHGLAWRDKQGVWEWNEASQTGWKDAIRPIFSRYADAMPGSLVEEKATTIAYHYRNVADATINARLQELENELHPHLRDTLLKLMKGKMVYEVMSNAASKGTAANAWVDRDVWDFVLAMGDDVTDEAMFEELPQNAYTVKVGPGKTAARLALDTQSDAIALLKRLAMS